MDTGYLVLGCMTRSVVRYFHQLWYNITNLYKHWNHVQIGPALLLAKFNWTTDDKVNKAWTPTVQQPITAQQNPKGWLWYWKRVGHLRCKCWAQMQPGWPPNHMCSNSEYIPFSTQYTIIDRLTGQQWLQCYRTNMYESAKQNGGYMDRINIDWQIQ